MLDAYIINRIQREKSERLRRETQIPLQIERPRPPGEDNRNEREVPEERGSVVIDFRV